MQDLTGSIFDRLTVIEFYKKIKNKNNYKYFWKCKCKCGNIVIRRSDSLKEKGISSCGCYRIEFSKAFFTNNNPKKTHGKANTRLYKIYNKIKYRCNNKNYHEFYLYGGRGIRMCKEWDNFNSFYEWSILNGYNDKLSIDRIDYNKNYSPENCRWSNNVEQANNKRNNIILSFNGQTHTMPEWARILNLPYSTLANRRKKGKSIEEILNPIKKR